ncbi:hypothetical protein ACFQE5_06440 [Pseudonocardia hispaniensis]|uniref:Uncharacterized protein n=1 Tax=Pseudonocardia hispaniensis TaxID=904933 RepID=A0ABW1J074_9PSEU
MAYVKDRSGLSANRIGLNPRARENGVNNGSLPGFLLFGLPWACTMVDMTGVCESTRRIGSNAYSDPDLRLPSVARDLSELVPAIAAVHRMTTAEVRELATRWRGCREWIAAELDRADLEGARREELRVFERLGRAAWRLVELRTQQERAVTCPACWFVGLDQPPYLAFEGPPNEPLKPPYAVHFGDPSRQRCPRCGYGFGLDDDPDDGSDPISFEVWRWDWRDRDCPWFDVTRRPGG